MHTQPNDMTDEELIKLYQRTHKREYFEPLYNRYVKKVYLKCLRMIADGEVAKDLTQDVFLKVLDKVSTFQHRSSYSTWLYRISHNCCLEAIRCNKRVKLESISSKADFQVEDNQASILLEQDYFQFRQWIDQLSSGERFIFELRYEKKYSIKQISNQMELSESAIKMRLKRFRTRLKIIHDGIYANLNQD